MLLFGGIFYVIFAEGTVQPWAVDDNEGDSDERQVSNLDTKPANCHFINRNFSLLIQISILLFIQISFLYLYEFIEI